MDYSKILDDLIFIYQGYNKVYRKSTQPFIQANIQKHFPNYQFHHDDIIVRESLLEHTGSLPIIAVHLHPFMDQGVDLGKSLTMLAFHDIGELYVGDELTFTKSIDESKKEIEAALSLIHPSQHKIYLEMSQQQTNEAKFSKSLDKLAPDFLELLTDKDVVAKRLSEQANWKIVEVNAKVQEKKRPYMLWSKFLTGFHDYLFERRRQLWQE